LGGNPVQEGLEHGKCQLREGVEGRFGARSAYFPKKGRELFTQENPLRYRRRGGAGGREEKNLKSQDVYEWRKAKRKGWSVSQNRGLAGKFLISR